MKTKGRGLIIFSALFLALGLAVGLSFFLPDGVSVTNARGIDTNMTRADIEAKFGRPVYVRPLPVACRPSALIGVWELSDGWLILNFDDDGSVQSSYAYAEQWSMRKRKRLKWAFGW